MIFCLNCSEQNDIESNSTANSRRSDSKIPRGGTIIGSFKLMGDPELSLPHLNPTMQTHCWRKLYGSWEEIKTMEKAGVIVWSASPWVSPIVIVPKKTALGKPPRCHMCVDYHILNSLLPCVDKAHSKGKGILTLVLIPKIDEIYAKLEGSTIYSTFDMCSGYYHLEFTPESLSKSAFVVGGPRGGKWEFKRCLFGLTKS